MKLLKFAVPFAATIISLAFPAWAQEEGQVSPQECGSNPINAIVKLEVETATSLFDCPWANRTGNGVGSGVVIGDGRILTCAHCVADASFIAVRKHNEDTLYHATVMFIDHDADLALVRVEESKFMSDITPMEIGETPQVQDEIVAVGYPVGGDDISYTRGIVSRIEDIRYEQGWACLLGVQVDAAINPGNSGGPVLDMKSGRIAGIAFQGKGKEEGEALGYIIPPDVIRHFFADIQDGKVDGFPENLFDWDTMENPAKRHYYGMDAEQTGVVIANVDSAMGKDSLRRDDILLEVDGYKVSNIGRVRLAGGAVRSFAYLLYTRQLGEKVQVKVLRKGAVVEMSIAVAKQNTRVRRWVYDRRPDYFVYGGLVFTTVSFNYLVAFRPDFHDDLSADKAFCDDEPVAISFCFSDKGVDGYRYAAHSLVRSVNGVRVRNLRHLAELVDQCPDGFVRFGLDKGNAWDSNLVVDAKGMREATERVMKRNLIPADRSEDLRKRAAQ